MERGRARLLRAQQGVVLLAEVVEELVPPVRDRCGEVRAVLELECEHGVRMVAPQALELGHFAGSEILK
jgi:hypothetical protein